MQSNIVAFKESIIYKLRFASFDNKKYRCYYLYKKRATDRRLPDKILA